ncbi:MAG: PTS sugar transporter subunit IIA [Planctomycetota bacterium]|jgi:mannitol/fructose-specific phosphotransferase system IIA component (Ntr-type)|nr:PTS sugar transporter subunit IIA [Planctomycetota bacterium]
MRLRDLLDESVVKVDLKGLEKEECFEEMIDLLVRAGRLSDRAGALEAVRQREAQGTTGIGQGVAIPHGKHPSVPALTAALGVSKSGIAFDSIDGAKVHLVFLLLARNDDPGPHVRALAEIARLIQTPGLYRKMAGARSAKEVLDLLDAEE